MKFSMIKRFSFLAHKTEPLPEPARAPTSQAGKRGDVNADRIAIATGFSKDEIRELFD